MPKKIQKVPRGTKRTPAKTPEEREVRDAVRFDATKRKLIAKTPPNYLKENRQD